MSQKKLNSKRLGYRLLVGTSTCLTIATVFMPVMESVVYAGEFPVENYTDKRTGYQNEMIEFSTQDLPIISSTTETEQSINSSTETEQTTSDSQSSNTNSSSQEPKPVAPSNPGKPPALPSPAPVAPLPVVPPAESSNHPVPVNPTPQGNGKQEGNGIMEDQPIHFARSQSTAEFVKEIGEEAREIAGKNDLYASVMIAQAILESGSGNSRLARSPNHNLFGIKGSYEGKSVNMPTLEDNGKGQMYSIKSSFRKYPSYKESLEDYAKLLKGGTGYVSAFYQGTWKSNTKSYKDATAFLTGRYATDTKYHLKLNGLIETYELDKFDQPKDKPANKKSGDTIHKVAPKESLWGICEKYESSLADVIEWNHLKKGIVFVGQELIVKKGSEIVKKDSKEEKTGKKASKEHKDEKEVDSNKLVLSKASEVGNSLRQKLPSVFYDESNYKVSAKRKKSNHKYHVMKGDSIKSISESQGIPINKLIEWNDLDKKILTEGQSLNLSSPFSSYI